MGQTASRDRSKSTAATDADTGCFTGPHGEASVPRTGDGAPEACTTSTSLVRRQRHRQRGSLRSKRSGGCGASNDEHDCSKPIRAASPSTSDSDDAKTAGNFAATSVPSVLDIDCSIQVETIPPGSARSGFSRPTTDAGAGSDPACAKAARTRKQLPKKGPNVDQLVQSIASKRKTNGQHQSNARVQSERVSLATPSSSVESLASRRSTSSSRAEISTAAVPRGLVQQALLKSSSSQCIGFAAGSGE